MERILWLDLEMTGLDVDKEVIIEVAAVVTDLNFTELDVYHSVVYQDQKYIDAMDDWNKEHHGRSGLIAKIPTGQHSDQVDRELQGFIKKHFSQEKGGAVLAGNSIAQDRRFIKKYWPLTEGALHYRMLDVSSWKIIFKEKFNKEFKKSDTHEALHDIRESIAELKFYLDHIDLKS